MSAPVAITGTGAVSAAGWGVRAMMDVLENGTRIAPSMIVRECGGGPVSTPVLRVPAEGANVPKFARLRRSSPISKFAAAAAVEALGAPRMALAAAGQLRVGVIFTLFNGCVNYSNRFFGEVLADPAMASPILFPETVFNAPSSHLSAMLGSRAPNDSLIADSTGFLSGIDLAIEWLERGEVDGCLVVCSEETDWLSAEGLRLYSRQFLPAEGAAAVYLEIASGPVRVVRLPEPVSHAFHTRRQAAAMLRERLAVENYGATRLVDDRCGIPHFDAAIDAAWADWRGPRWSPKILLGESMGAATGMQCVAATAAVESGACRQVVVAACGGNQQSAGMCLQG
jgi:hypothetical protein